MSTGIALRSVILFIDLLYALFDPVRLQKSSGLLLARASPSLKWPPSSRSSCEGALQGHQGRPGGRHGPFSSPLASERGAPPPQPPVRRVSGRGSDDRERSWRGRWEGRGAPGHDLHRSIFPKVLAGFPPGEIEAEARLLRWSGHGRHVRRSPAGYTRIASGAGRRSLPLRSD